MNVLVISSVFPAPLSGKLRENDALFKSAEYHQNTNRDIHYTFLYVIPYSNFLLSFFSNKWREYRRLKKKGYYIHGDKYVHVIAMPGFRNDYWIKKTLIKIGLWINRKYIDHIIKNQKINIIHAHNVGSNAAIGKLLKRKYKLPYVVTARNIHNNVITPFVRDNLRQASALVSLSPSLKKIADDYNDRSILIPHGIDSSFFIRKRPVETNSVLKIITVCRLLDWKNVDKIIYALNDVDFDFRYDIYGEGPYRETLKKIIESSPHKSKIRLLDFIPYNQVPKVLSQYDVLALISFPETFGRIYIEAMAAGLPIIAAKGSGMDGVIQNGKQGFIVPHDDNKSVVEALAFYFSHDKARFEMSKEAQKLASSFGWESVVMQLDELYLELLN